MVGDAWESNRVVIVFLFATSHNNLLYRLMLFGKDGCSTTSQNAEIFKIFRHVQLDVPKVEVPFSLSDEVYAQHSRKTSLRHAHLIVLE